MLYYNERLQLVYTVLWYYDIMTLGYYSGIARGYFMLLQTLAMLCMQGIEYQCIVEYRDYFMYGTLCCCTLKHRAFQYNNKKKLLVYQKTLVIMITFTFRC